MAAPRPTPTELKLVKGNPGKRKINKNEPKPARVISSCPDYLSPGGQIFINLTINMPGQAGTNSNRDGSVEAAGGHHCWRRSHDIVLGADSGVFSTKQGNGGGGQAKVTGVVRQG